MRRELVLCSLLLVACDGRAHVRVEAAELHPARLVTARIEPEGGVARVAVSHTSSVARIAVSLGDRVTEGALLAEMARAPDTGLLDDRSELLSPIDGTVVAIHCARGDTLLPGTPVFELADLERLVARASVEPDAVEGVTAPVEVALGDTERRATLARLPIARHTRGGLLAEGDEAEARVLVTVPLPSDVEWTPFAELALRIPTPPVAAAATLPRAAIRIEEGDAVVELPALLGARARTVELGASDAERVEVRGLDVGTEVLVPGGSR